MSTHKKSSKSKSRKATPWDEKEPLTGLRVCKVFLLQFGEYFGV